MAEAGAIAVEVVYALPERQELLRVEVPAGTTLIEAIERSGIGERFPGLEIDPGRVGIFGQKARPDTVLQDGDRVEIYRPLEVTPQEARRLRAAANQE